MGPDYDGDGPHMTDECDGCGEMLFRCTCQESTRERCAGCGTPLNGYPDDFCGLCIAEGRTTDMADENSAK